MTAKTAVAQLHFILEEHAVNSRKWLAAIEAELTALREQNKKLQQEAALILPPSLEPVGWVFERAGMMSTRPPKTYSGWGSSQFSEYEPAVPAGSIRNLRQVFVLRPRPGAEPPAQVQEQHVADADAAAAAAIARGNLVIRSTHGQFEASPVGRVLSFTQSSRMSTDMSDITWFNLSEYYRTYYNEPPTQEFDILDLGYWLKDGRYVEPEADFRKHVAEENSERGTHSPS